MHSHSLFLFVLFAFCHCKNIYVNPSSGLLNNCGLSLNASCHNLAAALSMSSNGDNIQIASGAVLKGSDGGNMNLVINNTVTIESVPSSPQVLAVVDLQGMGGFFVRSNTKITLKNMKVVNGKVGSSSLIVVGANGLYLESVMFQGNGNVVTGNNLLTSGLVISKCNFVSNNDGNGLIQLNKAVFGQFMMTGNTFSTNKGVSLKIYNSTGTVQIQANKHAGGSTGPYVYISNHLSSSISFVNNTYQSLTRTNTPVVSFDNAAIEMKDDSFLSSYGGIQEWSPCIKCWDSLLSLEDVMFTGHSALAGTPSLLDLRKSTLTLSEFGMNGIPTNSYPQISCIASTIGLFIFPRLLLVLLLLVINFRFQRLIVPLCTGHLLIV